MKTYSIHPNSQRIDKTNFPTKEEAISRAAECAKILNRGISVYEVSEPGTDTQKDDYPKIQSPFKHIAFVLPSGKVEKGEHPAIKLMEKDPAEEELESYPYALGCVAKLATSLEGTAKNPAVPADLRKELLAFVDVLQHRAFESQEVVAGLLETSRSPEDVITGYVSAMGVGTKFKSSRHGNVVHILHVDPTEKVVSFASSVQDGKPVHTSTTALAKALLRGGFEIVIALPEEPPAANQAPVRNTPMIRSPEEDAKILEEARDGKTLSEQLSDATNGEDQTLLAYCMSICQSDIVASEELTTAFLDAFKTQAGTKEDVVGQLRAMTSFSGHKLPEDWFVTAQRKALAQLLRPRPAIALAAPVEVQRAAANATKWAKEHGVALAPLVGRVSASLARGDALDLQALDCMHLYLRTATAEASKVEFNAWGGHAGKMWITKIFKDFPQRIG